MYISVIGLLKGQLSKKLGLDMISGIQDKATVSHNNGLLTEIT